MGNADPFETALKEARKALAEALEERSATERRIVSLKQTIEGLSALCEPEPIDDSVQVGKRLAGYCISLTDAIRKIFSESQEYLLTPPQVRDALLAMGVDLAKYKQPLVPIHNTLKRLESQGELVPFKDDNGDFRGYRWVSPLARAVAEVDAKHPIHQLHQRRVAVNPGGSGNIRNWMALNEPTTDPIEDTLSDMLKKKRK